MMSDDELLVRVFQEIGESIAQKIQNGASDMTPSEIVASSPLLPLFNQSKNYLEKPVGYVCKTSDGNVWRLLQKYDSSIYTGSPETLPAQWAPYWTKNPEDARPFMALSTAPYSKDDCCTFNGKVYKSTIDNNVWSPEDYALGWDEVL